MVATKTKREKRKVLVVEDDEAQRGLLTGFLARQGFEAPSASTGAEALMRLKQEPCDLVLLDFRLPDMDGLQVLSRLRKIQPEVPVIFITAFGTIEVAVKAMKAGASDFLTKPIDLDLLLLRMEGIRERADLARENQGLRERLAERYRPSNIICGSPQMEEVLGIVSRVAQSSSTVLIRGESGTGKELIASAIHYASPRHGRPFIKVSCSALPETLLEGELFGHEKGAFTGALQRRIGRLEAADGGTLFLDEIGDVPLPIQAKLLRFLQEREFERLGSNTPIEVDVRTIAATHRDLEAAVREEAFRQDLYYRLQVIPIFLPPLRERREDIPPLIDHFLRKYSERDGKEIGGISPEARHFLLTYDYPGNVRELENIVERAVVLSRRAIIGLEDLPLSLRDGKAPGSTSGSTATSGSPSEKPGLPGVVLNLEKDLILQALQANGGNQSAAARSLGISERVLRYKMRKYGLKGR
jgi:two-component system NtrC family response regulator